MGSQTRQEVGFPSNTVKGADFRFNPGCGGSGAGACFLPASFSYLYWQIKVNPFSRRNNLLVLRDDFFLPYTNAGSDGLCPNSNGAQVAFDILLMYEEPLTLDRSLATAVLTIPSNASLPLTIEFVESLLPQPDHPDYERRIWVVLDFGVTGRMLGGAAQIQEMMDTIKLDFEGTP